MLAANDAALATVALRPRLIWGAGRQPAAAAPGRTRARPAACASSATASNRIDTTYIDNAAQAHFDAFEHLAPGAACAGRAYFISNGEPKTVREIVNGLLRRGRRAAGDKHHSVRRRLCRRRGLRRRCGMRCR